MELVEIRETSKDKDKLYAYAQAPNGETYHVTLFAGLDVETAVRRVFDALRNEAIHLGKMWNTFTFEHKHEGRTYVGAIGVWAD